MELNPLVGHQDIDEQSDTESVNGYASHNVALEPRPRARKWLNIARKCVAISQIYTRHLKDLVFSERINALLIFVPIGIIIGALDVDPIVVFILNALAIIPLAVVISTATEKLASRLGDTLGALLNVIVGNSAELMIFYIALARDHIRIVQASLLGSVLVNLLVVLGTAFVAGGLRHDEQLEDRPTGRLSVWLLDIGLFITIFPITFYATASGSNSADTQPTTLTLSRACSFGLILSYILYLIFQVRLRPDVRRWDEENAQLEVNTAIPLSAFTSDPIKKRQKQANSRQQLGDRAASVDQSVPVVDRDAKVAERSSHTERNSDQTQNNGIAVDGNQSSTVSEASRTASPSISSSASSPPPRSPTIESDQWNDETPTHSPTPDSISPEVPFAGSPSVQTLAWARSHPPRSEHRRQNTMIEYREHMRSEQHETRTPLSIAVIVLIVSAGIASLCTELVVGAIPTLIISWDLSEIFLGLIILPVVGNAAEHVTATKLALRNKMPLAKNVAIESSTYITLLVTPAIVLLGWARGKNMSLQFEVFEIASVVLASVVASCLVILGKTDWKQGALLLTTFLVIAVGSLIYSELE